MAEDKGGGPGRVQPRTTKEEDLARTAEVAALPLDPSSHETVPIDMNAATDAPPPASRKPTAPPHEFASEPPPTTVRVALPLDEAWLGEETSLTRATEKTQAAPAQVVPDRVTLTVLTGLHAGQVFSIDRLEHIVGRGTDADFWVEDPAISRRHARIVRRLDGRYAVEDLGSTNGTFVAGRRVEGRIDLQNGDRVQIGPTLMFRFAITDDAEDELQRRLYESSTRDALTRAFNRKYFGERLLAEIAHARRHKAHLALLMLDLDRFKAINDQHGHLAGDVVLRAVATQVQRLIRLEDVLARYGGEEFVILLRSTPTAGAVVLAERVRSTVERLQIAVNASGGPTTVGITTSIGVASLSELSPEAGPNELVATADARLYRAKVGGRNRVCGED
jgi:diguanylate cyclase (GGDEF)-like protein